MESIRAIYENALLAQAAYAPLPVDNGLTIYGERDLNAAIRDTSKVDKAEFTDAQATNFTGPQGYTLRSFTSDPTTGFQAALFESRTEPGKYTLAIRGTAGLMDIVGADIFGVVAQGQASAQSLSLYRYYKRLITTQGAAVQYSQAEIEMLAAVTNRKYDGHSIAELRTYADFRATSADLTQRLSVDVGLGRLDANAIIDVTGHSLGGHLAQVFGALFFPERINRIYTYNGAGLGASVYSTGKEHLSELGIDLAAMSTNIVAEEGLTLTAASGFKFGPIQRLAIEEGVLTDNHSIVNATDSLALYDLFGQASPDLSLESFNKIVRSATNQAKSGYEETLDALRRIFLGANILPTQRSFRDDLAGRDELYKNIDEVKNSTAFKDFAGAIGRPNSIASVVGVVDWAAFAIDDANGVAYRYALQQLNPFAVVGFDYAQYNQNGELDLYDSATGRGEISKEWIRDRAQFLTWKNQKNISDIADDAPILRKDNGPESYLYTDKTLKNSQGQDYSIRVTGGNGAQQINISFAGNQGDTLSGGNYADHLYGGRGRDALAGGDGNDYQEGGAGDDTLTGDGGDDTLIGGRGNDVLQGGDGNDVYIVRAGDGEDRILDRNGNNAIVYVDASGQRTYLGGAMLAVAGEANSWLGRLPDGGVVTVSQDSVLTASFQDGTSIAIEAYREGDFGIPLLASVQDDASTPTIVGDLATLFVADTPQHVEYDDLGNLVVDPDLPEEGKRDRLWGSDGDDVISTGTGIDIVLANGGADRIVGGGSDDYLDGGDGDDVIEGHMDLPVPDNSHQEFLIGGKGNDRLYAYEAVELSEDTIAGPSLDESFGMIGAVLIGADGDDSMVGSDYRDELYGGMGNDVLAGGSDNDYLCGDIDFELVCDNPTDTLPQRHWLPRLSGVFDIAAGDDDILFGGNGDDWLYGDGGSDWLSGGDGNDKLFGGIGSDTLFGDGGNDMLVAAGQGVESSPSDYDVLDGGDGVDILAGGAGFNLMFGGTGNDYLYNGTGDTIAYGGEGNDTFEVTASGYVEFHGDAGNDIFRGRLGESYADGGEGDDLLCGGAGADVLIGGPGNDVLEAFQNDILEGGEGDDVYKFRLGAGENTVADEIGANEIVLYSFENPDYLEAPILSESVRLTLEEDQYRISYGDQGDSILLGATEFSSMQGLTLRHLTGYDYVTSDNEDDDDIRVEVFEDEFIPFLQNDLQQLGSGGDDLLLGDATYKNKLNGRGGDDVLIGTAGGDTLIGGAGNDTLIGDAGGDIYYFGLGSGHDLVLDLDTDPNNADTVVLGDGITAENISVLRGNYQMTLAVAGTDDRLAIQWQPEEGYAIERVQFADGAIWDRAMLESQAVPDPQADAGAGEVDAGGVPAGGGGGAEAPPDGSGSQAGNGEGPAVEGGGQNGAVVTTGNDAAPAGEGSVSPTIGEAPIGNFTTALGSNPPPLERERGSNSAAPFPAETGHPSSGPFSVDVALPSSSPSPADEGLANAAATPAEGGSSPSLAETGERAGARGQSAATIPSQQEALAEAMRMLAATESAAAPAQSRGTNRPVGTFEAQSAGAASAPTPNPPAYFTALQPVQPNMQTWLDNWLGPSARPSTSARDPTSSLPPTGAGQPSSVEDTAPSNPQSDTPETLPAEFLTPEQITQSYEDLQLWLAANPGVEQGIAGAGGSLPERNLFAGMGSGFTHDAGSMSMPRFGETPGMAVISGNALQPLRGINEGYALLGVL